MSEYITIACAEPGCERTTPALASLEEALGIAWTCPAHSGQPVWPAAHEPCDYDADCGRACDQEDDGRWMYETTRAGADVMAYCRCEHHDAATPWEVARGIGYIPAPPLGRRWGIDPWASRHHEARAGASAIRARAFAMHGLVIAFPNGMHPVIVQATGQTPVVAGDPRYVAAWPDELALGCPAWPEP